MDRPPSKVTERKIRPDTPDSATKMVPDELIVTPTGPEKTLQLCETEPQPKWLTSPIRFEPRKLKASELAFPRPHDRRPMLTFSVGSDDKEQLNQIEADEYALPVGNALRRALPEAGAVEM